MNIKDLLGDTYKEGMSIEDLLNTEVKDPNDGKKKKAEDETKHLKELISKANSEAASYKKQLKAKMSEEEAKKAEQEEVFNQMKEKLASLEQEKAISDQKAQFVSLGYDADLAQKGAEALVNGNLEEAFDVQKTFLEGYKKKVIADKMVSGAKTPKQGGDAPKVTQDKFNSMTYKERLGLYKDHRDVYDKGMDGTLPTATGKGE